METNTILKTAGTYQWFTKDYQYLFFTNCTWRISAHGVDTGDVFSTDLFDPKFPIHTINKRVTLQEPAFTVVCNGDDQFDILIYHQNCPFFNFLIQTSRIYWRQEQAGALMLPPVERMTYYEKNRFNIESEFLTADQNWKQKQNLISKIFAIGHLMHRCKDRSKAWAVYVIDAMVNKNGESAGCSGKSIAFDMAIKQVLGNVFHLNGRNPKLFDNPHTLHRLTIANPVLLVDDAAKKLQPEAVFEFITGDTVVNPQGRAPYTIPFEDAGKLIWITTHRRKQYDPSLQRRCLFTVFSDYYHPCAPEFTYAESYDPMDDFDSKPLFDGFSNTEWNHFYTTMANCLRFSLSCPVKFDGPDHY